MSRLYPAGALAQGVLASADTTSPGIATLRWSTHGYTSSPSDDPTNAHYEARVLGDVVFEHAIPLGAGVLGRAALGFGEIALWDGDGKLSSLMDTYAIDGRALRLKIADGTGAQIGSWPAMAAFSTVFAGRLPVGGATRRPHGCGCATRLRGSTCRYRSSSTAGQAGSTGRCS